eukprot:SAG31_NODE_28_length_32713_cov_39.100509_14_plen_83_part_00
MHELHSIVAAIMVPEDRSAWSELIDAAVPQPNIILARQLLPNLDHLRVRDDGQKWKTMVYILKGDTFSISALHLAIKSPVFL